MIYPQNSPGTSKKQHETLKNENPLGTMKNELGTLNNHKNRPGTIEKLTWNLQKP